MHTGLCETSPGTKGPDCRPARQRDGAAATRHYHLTRPDLRYAAGPPYPRHSKYQSAARDMARGIAGRDGPGRDPGDPGHAWAATPMNYIHVHASPPPSNGSASTGSSRKPSPAAPTPPATRRPVRDRRHHRHQVRGHRTPAPGDRRRATQPLRLPRTQGPGPPIEREDPSVPAAEGLSSLGTVISMV